MEYKQLLGKIKLGAKRNAPELLLGAGLVTGTACMVMTGRQTIKAQSILEDSNETKVNLAEYFADGILTEQEYRQEIVRHYSKLALSLAKEYAVPAALYAATVTCVFSSYKIQKKRQLALSAALASCTAAYTTLVGKLKNGAAHGLTAKDVLEGYEMKEVVDPETGEITHEKVKGEPISTDLYKVRFDRYSTAWEKDKFQNECTLKSEENWANDVLRLQGYLFLNDVYDRLGLPRTRAGQVVGWLYQGDGDGFVDFGVTDCESYDDVRYDSNAFDLNFNVDGDILTKFSN